MGNVHLIVRALSTSMRATELLEAAFRGITSTKRVYWSTATRCIHVLHKTWVMGPSDPHSLSPMAL